jgi:putative nucleotidyltransferase with HDIG domain
VIRRAAHLGGRFARSLRPGGPRAADVEWAQSFLSPAETTLWTRMPAADRRESVWVARRLQQELEGTADADDARWVVAALLHDVGKSQARLGTIGRALATMAGGVAGHGVAAAWQARGGIARRFGLYLRHDEIGAGMLEMAGSRPEVVAWARVHHHPERWDTTSVPPDVAAALARADGERD